MNKFLLNFRNFIDHYKIKQNIIGLKIGYDKNKLSRLLNGKTSLTYDDMEKLSKAVGKNVSYFMEDFKVNDLSYENLGKIAFSAGKPTPQKTEYANKLFDLLEHIDLIIGMEKKINCNLNEV